MSKIRECFLVKNEEEQYEFYIKESKRRGGQIVFMITPCGPADRAELKEGDRIMEVNGKDVKEMSHADIVEMVKESMLKNEIYFKVISEEDDEIIEGSVQHSGSNSINNDFRPRRCKVKKKKGSFVFEVVTNKNGHFMKTIEDNSAAAKSGLRSGDRIIEINKKNIESFTHKQIVARIKKSGKKLILLVVDDATYKHYSESHVEIESKHAYRSISALTFSSLPQSNRNEETIPVASSLVELSANDALDVAFQIKRETEVFSNILCDEATVTLKTFSADQIITLSSTISDDDVVRTVHVMKDASQDLDFTTEEVKGDVPGEIVRGIQSGKASYLCGLRESDLVLAVNGKVILTKSHNDVCELFKSNSNHVLLDVLGPKGIKKAKTEGILSTLEDAKKNILKKPLSIKIRKQESGYGFSLKTEKLSLMHICDEIEKDSPAEHSGIKNGDVLLCIESSCVMKKKHSECVRMMREAKGDLHITTGNRLTADRLYSLNLMVTEDMLETWPDLTNQPNYSHYDYCFKDKNLSKEEQLATEVVEVRDQTKPRLSHLKKINGSYGFFLSDDSSLTLSQIKENGAAHKAGINKNDRILEINGVNVENENYLKVVEQIQGSGDEITLLVVAGPEKSLTRTSSSGSLESLINLIPEVSLSYALPRYCVLVKGEKGFGFQLSDGAPHGSNGHIVEKLEKQAIAHSSGLCEGDLLISVNDINVQTLTHDEVAQIIKRSESTLHLLVIDEESELYYRKMNIPITKALAVGVDVDRNALQEAEFGSSSSLSSDDTFNNIQQSLPSSITNSSIGKENTNSVNISQDQVTTDSTVSEEENEEAKTARVLTAKERKERINSGLEDIHEEAEDGVDQEPKEDLDGEYFNKKDKHINYQSSDAYLKEFEITANFEVKKDFEIETAVQDEANSTAKSIVVEALAVAAAKHIVENDKTPSANNVALLNAIVDKRIQEKDLSSSRSSSSNSSEGSDNEVDQFEVETGLGRSKPMLKGIHKKEDTKELRIALDSPDQSPKSSPKLEMKIDLQSAAVKDVEDITFFQNERDQLEEVLEIKISAVADTATDIELKKENEDEYEVIDHESIDDEMKNQEENLVDFSNSSSSDETDCEEIKEQQTIPTFIPSLPPSSLKTKPETLPSNQPNILSCENGIEVFEKTEEINWSGNGMSIKIIETSNFK